MALNSNVSSAMSVLGGSTGSIKQSSTVSTNKTDPQAQAKKDAAAAAAAAAAAKAQQDAAANSAASSYKNATDKGQWLSDQANPLTNGSALNKALNPGVSSTSPHSDTVKDAAGVSSPNLAGNAAGSDTILSANQENYDRNTSFLDKLVDRYLDEHSNVSKFYQDLITKGMDFKDALSSGVESIKDAISGLGQSADTGSGSGSVSGTSAAGVSQANADVDYLYADLAKHYGLGVDAAYSESLSNTAYQRAVKDMQSAGLNPAVLMSSGSAASSTSGLQQLQDNAPEESSASGSSNSNGWTKWIPVVGAAIGAVLTKSTRGLNAGLSTGKAIFNALK